MIDLTGQTILLTGASRGIGAATAEVLLNAGANVVGGYTSAPGALEALAQQFGEDRLLPVQMDLSEVSAGFRLWEAALAFKGSLNGLVNNAGIAPSTPHTAPEAQWHTDWAKTMQVNVHAVADLCKAAIESFEAARKINPNHRGRIVTVASRASFRGDQPDSLHYAASKGALPALMRSIARGFADQGIYAFTIAPGWVATDMAEVVKQPGNEWMLDEIPTRELVPPTEVGNLIAMMLSGLMDQTTGTTVDINGASYVR